MKPNAPNLPRLTQVLAWADKQEQVTVADVARLLDVDRPIAQKYFDALCEHYGWEVVTLVRVKPADIDR